MGQFQSTITFRGSVGNNTGRKTSNGLVLGIKNTGTLKAPSVAQVGNRQEMAGVFGMSAFMINAMDNRNFVNPAKSVTTRGKYTKILRTIEKLSVGPFGQRPILLSAQLPMIKGLAVGKKNFKSVCMIDLGYTSTPDRLSSTVAIPVFNPFADLIKVPANTTHCRIFNMLTVVSDRQWDNAAGKYVAIDSINDGLSTVVASSYIPINAPFVVPEAVVAALPGAPVLTADVSVINYVGIEFYQEVNLEYIPYRGSMAMNVEQVF